MLKLRIYQHICANEDSFVLVGCSKTDPAAQMVSDQIAETKESGSYSLQDIEKAKERYNSLTDDQKKQVKNYADLLKMEDAYEDDMPMTPSGKVDYRALEKLEQI